MAYIGNKPPVVDNLITDIKIGEDDETKIDFADANTINFHANNSKEMVLVENALTPGTNDGIALGTTSLMWSDLFLASGAVINFNNGNVTMTHSADTLTVVGATVAFTASTAVTVSNDLKLVSDSAVLGFGADNDTTLTHTDGTGLTLNSTNKLTFGDAASFIQQSSDGTLRIDGEAIIDLNASTRVDVSGALTAGGIIKTDDTTAATSTTDGSLQTDGGLSVAGDAVIGDDLILLSDSAVLKFGADSEATITHANDAGLTFNSATTFSSSIDLALDAHLDSTPGDEKVSGITATFTAGEALERGECVYFKASDSKMHKAVATAEATSRCVALAAEDLSADASGKFLLYGFIEDNGTFPAYTVGGTIFTPEAETSSQNVPEQTAPDTDGDFVQVLGFAVTANKLFFNPSNDVIEHAG